MAVSCRDWRLWRSGRCCCCRRLAVFPPAPNGSNLTFTRHGRRGLLNSHIFVELAKGSEFDGSVLSLSVARKPTVRKRRCPLGGPKMPPRLRRGIGQGRANGQSDIEMRSRSCWLRERPRVGRGYAAAFFVGFDAGFGAAFLLVFPFSFAANSCLTVAEMASTSTL